MKNLKFSEDVMKNNHIDTIDYFKEQSGESGIPYQTLINLYLTDCANSKKKLKISRVLFRIHYSKQLSKN